MKKYLIILVVLCNCSYLYSAKFIQIKGDVQISNDNGINWKIAKRNFKIKTMDYIKTGNNSEAEIELVKGCKIKIEQNSQLAIRDLGFMEEKNIFPSVQMFIGRVFVNIKKMIVGKMEFHTQTSVIGVRGTEYYVQVNSMGPTYLEVENGQVDFSSVLVDKTDNKVMVNENEKAIMSFDLRPIVIKDKQEWKNLIDGISLEFNNEPDKKDKMMQIVLNKLLDEVENLNSKYLDNKSRYEKLNVLKRESFSKGERKQASQYNNEIYTISFDLHNSKRRMKHIKLRAESIKYLLGDSAKPKTIDIMLKINKIVEDGGK